MKATTILKLIERAREPMLKEAHIKAYAKDQIEKDRERVKEQIYEDDGAELISTSFKKTPIILD